MRCAILLALATLWLGLTPGASAALPVTAMPAGAQSVAPAAAGGAVTDPLDSARWGDMQKTFFAGRTVVFDPRVKISAPAIAEDSLNVPVSVDASALTGVEEVLVFADFNPILAVLRFHPGRARASLGFRLKLQQSSPVRAAARTTDGTWHVGGVWITATGGGCTAPSTGSGSPVWQERLNEVSGKIFPRIDGGERLRMRIIHPMDTGLAPGIPVFHIEELTLSDESGAELMRIQAFEPVSENPLFTIDMPPDATGGTRIHARGRDNNGNRIDAWVTQ
ncbi:quinoprotein dehydrogenase-associated SoxYZ-like carrier [Aromatoleum diolicum]|uniref:Quinoprotein dehydrogenase-associated SoxYZ-like carrier n=1 Tax=Aromatoleum diolicum TaxID=75796 RepID=A0ABX1Q7Z9_9RHOO|nr:quinoprotein dehydrogenase-associated SoxYZ-like carrier [Aromatoleum diolicum]NMG73546.1 quinoprotein dehydrogenase-associated SoxYZ-like carrier [Aromatoleum diolicum]